MTTKAQLEDSYNQALKIDPALDQNIFSSDLADIEDEHAPLPMDLIPEALKTLIPASELIKQREFIAPFTVPNYWLDDGHMAGLRAGCEIYRLIKAGQISAAPLALNINIADNTEKEHEKISRFISGFKLGSLKLGLELSATPISFIQDDSEPLISINYKAVNNADSAPQSYFTAEDLHIYILGREHGHLGSSSFAKLIHSIEGNAAPKIDVIEELKLGSFVDAVREDQLIENICSVSSGGIAAALAQMALPQNIGFGVGGIGNASFWYGEDQARFIVTVKTKNMALFEVAAQNASVSLLEIGNSEEDQLSFNNQKIAISEIKSLIKID